MRVIRQEDHLAHHGIQGQEWGVRNGPPYPIDHKTLKAGTKVNNVSLEKSSKKNLKSNKWIYTYNPNDEWDSKVYKGPFSMYLKNYRSASGASVYEHAYKVVKDLKMPTKAERVGEFNKMYKENKELVDTEMNQVLKEVRNTGFDKYLFEGTDSTSTEASQLNSKNLYLLFNKAMENNQAYLSTRKYSEIMSTKWDAMVDDFNQKIYNEAHDPVIIFDRSASLKPIKRAREVPMKEIWKNYDYVGETLYKKGKGVLL